MTAPTPRQRLATSANFHVPPNDGAPEGRGDEPVRPVAYAASDDCADALGGLAIRTSGAPGGLAIGARAVGAHPSPAPSGGNEIWIFDATERRIWGSSSSAWSARYTSFTASRIASADGQRSSREKARARSTRRQSPSGRSGEISASDGAAAVAARIIASCPDGV